MAVQPLDQFRIKVRFVDIFANLWENDYFVRFDDEASAPDTEVLLDLEQWIEGILGFQDNFTANNVDLAECIVDEVGFAGVYSSDPELNTAHVTTIRNLGQVYPNWTPAVAGDVYNPVVTGVITLKTGLPKVDGLKSYSGFAESWVAAGLLVNSLVANLATMAVFWSQGPAATGAVHEYTAGVISLSNEGAFIPFNNSMLITNIPGTRVTRKIGRGA